MLAINQALQFILEEKISASIIFSDSKTAIQKIAITKPNKETYHIALLAKRGILEAKSNGLNITLAWIPGHAGIKENYKADLLADIWKEFKYSPKFKTTLP